MVRRKADDVPVVESDEELSDVSQDEEIAKLTGLRQKKRSKRVEEVEEVEETIDEKRIRLAKQYIQGVGLSLDGNDEEEVEDEDEEYGSDAVGRELRKQALRASGREPRTGITHQMDTELELGAEDVTVLRGHRFAPTCLALSSDDKFAVTGSSDGSLMYYDLESNQRRVFSGAQQMHKQGICSVSLSSDGVYLASAGEDRALHIWDVRSGNVVHTFREHRDTITSVCFRRDSLMQFSGSRDRTLKVYDVEHMNFLETLYGHQGPVTQIDALYPDMAFSCGEDRTLRLWKLATESQALLKASSLQHSQDCLAAFTVDNFVTGSQSGALSLWSSTKKKPVDVLEQVHGAGRWLSSVAALYATDLCASGSNSGYVQIYQAGIANSKLKPLSRAPVQGWVNAMAFSSNGDFLACAVGKDHKFGRWDPVSSARNGLHVVSLRRMMTRVREQEQQAGEERDSFEEEDEDGEPQDDDDDE